MTSDELFEVGKALMEGQRVEVMTKAEILRAIEMAREILYDNERGFVNHDPQTLRATEDALYEFRDRLKTLEINELEAK